MGIRAQLSKLLDYTDRQERRFAGTLTPTDRSESGSHEHWSAKDLLSHLAAWKLRMADEVACALEGKVPPRFEDIDAENARIYAEYAGKSWPEVEAALAEGQKNLIEGLNRLSEADLTWPKRFEWRQGQPLWRGIAGNGCSHPLLHLAQAYVARGDPDYAAKMQEEVAELLVRLDDAPSWIAVVRYNLACFYALAGRKAKALDGLREALRLHPGLTEWSKEDTDLASLRDDPEYRALYTP